VPLLLLKNVAEEILHYLKSNTCDKYSTNYKMKYKVTVTVLQLCFQTFIKIERNYDFCNVFNLLAVLSTDVSFCR